MAIVYVLAAAAFVVAAVRRDVPDRDGTQDAEGNLREQFSAVILLVREHAELRAFLVANAMSAPSRARTVPGRVGRMRGGRTAEHAAAAAPARR